MNLGLRPANHDFFMESSNLLKKDLLYFDQIHLCSFTRNEEDILGVIKSRNPTQFDFLQNNFEFLKSKGLLCTFDLTEMVYYTKEEFKKLGNKLSPIDINDFKQILIDYSEIEIPDVEKIKKKFKVEEQGKAFLLDKLNKVENEVTRISSSFLNRFSSKDNAFPLLYNEMPNNIDPLHQSKVLEVILEKLPIPNENIDWQQIVDYRSDPDTESKFNALRSWMQDIARTDYTKSEIEERIKHILYEYEKHLKLHKLKYQHGKLRIFVTTSLEVLGNTLKLNWGKSAEVLFSLKEKKYDFLESEMSAPGRELAYLSKTDKIFK